MSKDSIAVLVPCYNEAATISKVVADFRAALPEATVYVYDNNSTDDTAKLAREAGAVVRRESRQGKGNVLRSMFRQIDADCYLVIDGDDTYPADHARDMVNAVLQEDADMVVGDRLTSTYFTENKRPFHNFGNKMVVSMVNRFFNGNVNDIMTGYRAFSRMFVKTFPVLSKGFEIETEMTIHALNKNMHIQSIPINYRDRPEGSESKLNTYSDGWKVMKTIVRLLKDYRPLVFFSVISAVLAIASIVLFIPIFVEFLQTGLVPRFPTLFVAIFFALVAIQLFTCGLILDTNSKTARQSFEINMNILYKLYHDDKDGEADKQEE